MKAANSANKTANKAAKSAANSKAKGEAQKMKAQAKASETQTKAVVKQTEAATKNATKAQNEVTKNVMKTQEKVNDAIKDIKENGAVNEGLNERVSVLERGMDVIRNAFAKDCQKSKAQRSNTPEPAKVLSMARDMAQKVIASRGGSTPATAATAAKVVPVSGGSDTQTVNLAGDNNTSPVQVTIRKSEGAQTGGD